MVIVPVVVPAVTTPVSSFMVAPNALPMMLNFKGRPAGVTVAEAVEVAVPFAGIDGGVSMTSLTLTSENPVRIRRIRENPGTLTDISFSFGQVDDETVLRSVDARHGVILR